MRRLTAPLIALALLVALIVGWRIFARTEQTRYAATRSIAHSKSIVRLHLNIAYARGRVAAEAFTMTDVDGVSSAAYAVTDRAGSVARFSEAIRGYDVSFFFDKLIADGLWDLSSKPPRGDRDARYTVAVEQTIQNQHGGRSFTFTDPQWWATTAGRQYEIHLDPHKPTPDLVQLASTSIAEPRYAKIVADFRNFGSDRFKRTVAQARAKLLGPS